MSANFKHLNADQQVMNGTITAPLFAVGAVTVQAMNINGNLNFNEYQALEFRVENVSTTPAAGNVGRIIYNTTSTQFLIDNGTAFVPIASSGAVTGVYSDSNPVLAGTIQFLSGTNVTLSQVGQAITINSTASGGVSSINSLVGAITLAAGSNVTITPSGNTLTIAATASPITTGNLTEAISNILTITGGTGAVVGTGTTIDVKLATTSQSGYLSSTDWNTFNNKQPAGSYITALTGDATASGPGSSTLTLTTVNSNVGSFTNANITVDAKGRITAASNGSSSSVNYQQDLFDIASSTSTFILTQTPMPNSQLVFWNGISLANGVTEDYTISGTVVTLNAGITVKIGDKILVTYAY